MRILLILLVCCNLARADISLTGLLSDGAVLQRGQDIVIRGKASPGERVRLTFRNIRLHTKADTGGNWRCTVPPQEAGGPYEMILEGKNRIILRDILIGDVWLCSGQSNMVLNMERVKEKYGHEIAEAYHPQIRNFFIKPQHNLNGPQGDFAEPGRWVAASPETVLEFGAVAYFFAREIYEQYKVPIGIINASVGGTPIQAWMSQDACKEFEDIAETIQRNKDSTYIAARLEENRIRTTERVVRDQGMTESPRWFDTGYTPRGWHSIQVPGFWEDQGLGQLDGIVWYRKEIWLDASMCDRDANLYLGRIVDSDHVYINGVEVGHITYQYPPRRYVVQKGILRPGKNIITVRIRNDEAKGGFVPDKVYALKAGGQEIDLKGTWHYKVGCAFEPVTEPFRSFSSQRQPASLFNAMIAPVTAQVAVAGVLWYQGEANVPDPSRYEAYLRTLIRDWRQKFDSPALPFFVVQLANFLDRSYLPAESNWARLRFDQLRATAAIDNTALIVTTDIGEWNDIHPLNKKGVGHRLALAARHIAYGEKDLPYSGPQFRSCRIAQDKIVASFDFAESGLTTTNGLPPAYFSLAGEDKKYYPAGAVISDGDIVVSSPSVPRPQYVRYAWADNPVEANLTNETGLPASCFEAGEDFSHLPWKNKKAAVILTYDDALDSHLDHVIPVLNETGLKASFYLPVDFLGRQGRTEAWVQAARQGHELGNHTMYHPCDGSLTGRSWVGPENDLSRYTHNRMMREIRSASDFLGLLDGHRDRTFAFTCGDRHTGEGSFADSILTDFAALRGITPGINTAENFDPTDVLALVAANENADRLIPMVEEAMAQNGMLVLVFHGVGGDHAINIDKDKHDAFVRYLASRRDELWITTLAEASRHILDLGR